MQSTLKSRTIFCRDNLEVLRGIDTETVDLIYLDPPFNTNKVHTSPIGSSAEGASFQDIFREEDVKQEWIGLIADKYPTLGTYLQGITAIGHRSNKYYLCYMAVRLIELYRVLKSTGSLYLHCDPTMSHYLKLLLDCIFGPNGFRNNIIWHYGGGGASKKNWGRKHDDIFFYTKGNQWTFNLDDVRDPHKWTDGQKRADGSERNPKGKIPDDVFHLHGVLPWANENTDYPTQKPIALLTRIIKASSHTDDVVLDPFCGCATTCVAAEKLNRQWVGIDVSKKAFELVKERLQKEVADPTDVFKYDNKIIYRADIPARTDATEALELVSLQDKKHYLYGKQNGHCNGCLTHFDYRNLTIDHIVPQVKGGGDNQDNLQLLCGHCNSIKGKKDMAFLHTRLKELGIRT